MGTEYGFSRFMDKTIFRLVRMFDFRLKPLETSTITDKLYVVRSDISNIYLYEYHGGLICFDAGFYTDNNLADEFQTLGFSSDDVTHLFLTHSDGDHAGRLDLFSAAKLYLSELEEPLVNGAARRLLSIYHNRPIKREYELVSDGDEIVIGDDTVKVISTPGHTPGSASYLINDEMLIVGDALHLNNGEVKPFLAGYSMDKKTEIESIRKLAKLPDISIMCTTHTGYTTDFANAIRKFK